jgi:error-prone DNA polymerase
MSGFAELVAATNYSFLRGASHPSDMVARAMELGMAGIGIADRNSVAGVVRAHMALREAGETDFRLAVGARLVFADGTPDIIAYPETRLGWGRLTRLLTVGNLRAEKGDCILRLEDLLEHCEDLLLIVLPSPRHSLNRHPREGGDPSPELSAFCDVGRWTPAYAGVTKEEEITASILSQLTTARPNSVWLGATMHRTGPDRRRLAQLMRLSAATGVPLLATNDALYAAPEQRRLHDIVTCIREGVTIASAGRRLAVNAERHLKPPREMARLFRDCPEAVGESLTLLSRIRFSLDDLRYEYPHEPVPEGWTPQDWLEHMVMEEARRRHPDGLPDRLRKILDEEFTLIRKCNYACYFLTVHDLVRFARAQDPPILCQGRGSAANSTVCYLLGITSIDPVENNLLFSRFLSEERKEPPDIDVDFEHERREEVMQYVYRRYGRHRAGIAATVIHYRSRSTVREVGKALGLSEDVTARLAGTAWGSYPADLPEERFVEAGFDPANPEMRRLHDLVGQLLEFPRHLSQHVGGFVLTQDRLDETVPIHNAAMEDRTFIEWDKDDIDALGLMKVDVLALGMLTCIAKSFALLEDLNPDRAKLTLATVPPEDPAVYDMLCRGDSIGVFQVESRAQINMLPRLRPREFYDLVIQVAIVRPGPIEGDMVHPYLRRRSGKEKVVFPSPAPPHDADELKGVLGRTLGVPLFQEQAMKLAITAAEFTPDEANGLRRAMATFRNVGTIHKYRDKMIGGMMRRGYEQDFAERCFKQIEGFGSYGFPESHAQSFAKLVYVSAWIKCHYPAVFACALLNSQPMGFYAPAQIVRDAREHGVEVRPADINASGWDNGLESKPLPFRSGRCGPVWGTGPVAHWVGVGSVIDLSLPELPHPPIPSPEGEGEHALRLGFRQIDGFSEDWATALVAARKDGPFDSMEALARRAGLPGRALRLLTDADACRSIGLDRRQALWEVRRMPDGELPLFAAAQARELAQEPDANLPPMPPAEHVVTDYQTTRLSLKGHPMAFLRSFFREEGVLSCAETVAAKNGARVRTAGVVLIRQRPGKGNAIFATIEDETGITNILIWARLFERYRRAVMASRLMLVEGEVQRSEEGVVHLMASRIIDRTGELDRLSEDRRATLDLARADVFDHPLYPRAGHPRNVRILPKSRDFQ